MAADGLPEPGTELTPHTVTPDAVDLFEFSAAIWLTHRIHYDAPYTTEVEQHPAMLIHGPLQAVHLTRLLRNNLGEDALLERFVYRHQSPAYVGQTLTCGGEVTDVDPGTGRIVCQIWVDVLDGKRTTVGEATLRRALAGTATT